MAAEGPFRREPSREATEKETPARQCPVPHQARPESRKGRHPASRKIASWMGKALIFPLLALLPIASVFAAEPPASTLIRQGKFSDAEQALRRTLAQNPQDATALTLLGEVRTKQRRYKQGEELFQQAVQANPRMAVAYQQLGSLYADEQRVDEAISAYETMLKLQPQNVKARAGLATLYQQKGNHQKSLALAKSIPPASRPEQLLPVMAADYAALNQSDEAQKVVGQIFQRATANPELVPQLATIFIRQGMAGDAGKLLRIAGDHQRITPSFLSALATVESSNGQSEQAKATVAKALELDTNHVGALLEKARQDGNAGDWPAAVGSLKKILQVAPPRIDVLQNLVFAAMQTDDLQTAHDAALDLYELNPARRDSALALAVVLVRASHWGEAKPVLEKMLAAYPDDKKAQLAMGIVQYNLGNIDPAAQLLSASLGQGAADAEAHYMLGLVDKQRGDFQAAADEMETSLANNPSKPEALSALGQIYLQLNQPDKARMILEKAVTRVPEDSQNHYQLGLAYRKLGMPDQARSQMELFQKLSARKVSQPTGEAAASPK